MTTKGEPEISDDKKTIEKLRETIATLDARLAEANREAHRWQNVATQWRIQHDKRCSEVVAVKAEAADLRAELQALTPPEVAE